MPLLTFDYGYDQFEIRITKAEEKLIREKIDFIKKTKVWSESEGKKVPAECYFTFSEDTDIRIECENGAQFYAHDYWVHE